MRNSFIDFSFETLNSSASKAIFLAFFSADNNSASVFLMVLAVGQKMNNSSPGFENVPTNIDLPENIRASIIDGSGQSLSSSETEVSVKISADVIQALHWLGKKSLEEYRLTSPAEENAYYYYSRLLEADPMDKVAAAGLLNIADRYTSLAERAIIDNDYSKAQAYINIGLKFNPSHATLIKLKKLNLDIGDKSFMEKLKGLFTGS